jgi:hypothetical protein
VPSLKESPNKAIPIPDANLYHVSRDVLNGTTSVSWGSEKAGSMADGGGYIHRRTITMTANDLAPWEATADGNTTFETVVGGSVTKVRSRSIVRSDASAFHADLSVEIAVDGALHWRRDWSKSFDRELL